MFAGIVDRVNDKLRKRQAVEVVPDALPVLVVEMSQSDLTSELRHQDFYAPEFEKMLDARLNDFNGYGIVALCEVVDWGQRLELHFMRIDPSVTSEALARGLFA